MAARVDAQPRWVTGGFETLIDRDPDTVFAFLMRIGQTPRWRDHLTSVGWRTTSSQEVGSLIDVVTTLAWYRRTHMVCRVVELDRTRRRFAYEVVEGPARIRNRYAVDPADGGRSRFTMEGGALLDTWYLRLVGPFLARMLVRATVPEVERLRALLDGHEE